MAVITDASEAWGGDPWDVAGGIVAIHPEITQRLASMAQDMLAAFDGDEALAEAWDMLAAFDGDEAPAEAWEFDQMNGPRRDEKWLAP